ncbi:MAG TPA: cystathionine beta-lyase [Geminicoccaceae bacterium]|nr:cystathionine beta-lyase [Geminicoccaceae bacterium]
MKDDTLVVTGGRDPEHNHGAVNPPVYRASTILYPSVEAFEAPRQLRGVYYGRGGVPTTFALEDAIAALEGAAGTVVTGSGKTAIAQALLSFLEAGDHLLMVDTAYAPTRQLCDRVLGRFGVEVTFYDPLIGADIERLVRPNTKVVFMESPGSLTFEVQDVPAIAAVARARGALSMLDNTWATPLYFKALDHGVDICIHAATKYICGHSDTMMGVASTGAALHQKLRHGMQDLGAFISPDDCYQGLKGLRTLAVRLERHQATGLRLAEWLRARPEVERVLHPALPDNPGHELWRRDFSGASGLFGVLLKPCPKEAWRAMVEGLELFGLGASWGGYESLIMPNRPERYRTATTWDPTFPSIRIHAGLEDPDDLIADLDAGFARLNRVRAK